MTISSFPTIQIPFELLVSQGHVSGYKTVFRTGYTYNCSTTITTILPQGVLYAFPPSASTMTLSSSSASDTAVVVLIQGLDANYEEVTEVRALTGQTPVNGSNTYLRINDLTVISGNAVGTVYIGTGAVTAGVPANVYCSIAIGDNASMSSVFTVPAGKTFYITAGSISSATAAPPQYIDATFYARINGVEYATSHITVSTSFQFFDYKQPLAIPEKSDLWTNVQSSSGTDRVAATAQGYLVTN